MSFLNRLYKKIINFRFITYQVEFRFAPIRFISPFSVSSPKSGCTCFYCFRCLSGVLNKYKAVDYDEILKE